MTGWPLPDRLTESSEWLVQAIDPRARLARLVKMDAVAYRQASFLDDRMMQDRWESRLCDLDQLVAVSSDVVTPAAGWIFHIGHVGSTLLSRLLGELDGVLSIREPRSLRDLSVASDTERPRLAAALSRFMARRGPNDRAVIVKATSFVSEYASLLIEPGSTAMFLHTSPANYIAGILAGENSVKELKALHGVRTQRLAGRGIALQGFDGNDAQRAAAAWACEMTSLEAAIEAMPRCRILWADFDIMLSDMSSWLGRAANHFELAASPQRIMDLAAGPLMRRYSKALEYDYSPTLRAELLAEATRNHLPQINVAIAALHEAAKSVPLLDRALKRAGREI